MTVIIVLLMVVSLLVEYGILILTATITMLVPRILANLKPVVSTPK
jgi:hypothetical protein